MGDGLHDGHRDRMRQRFLQESGEGFEEHELLEMLLYYHIPVKDTNVLAHKILNEYGSLGKLVEADPIEISRVCKIDIKMAILIALLKEVSRRCIQEPWKERAVLNSSEKATAYCKALMTYKHYENFYLICLDSRRRIIHTAKIAEGTIHEAVVHPRLVVETAIKYQASAVILTHNHPGGNNRPSFEDISLTTKLTKILREIDVLVIDHIIIADGKAYSFLQNKMMKEDREESI